MFSKKIFFYTALVVNILITLFFWWQSSGSSFTSGTADILIAIGRLFGLWAVLGVLAQFLMMGRSKWLEEVFGLDKLSRVHHLNGNISIFAIVLHPFFILWGYSMIGKTNFIAQLITFITTNDDL